jgi:hypothetical protein
MNAHAKTVRLASFVAALLLSFGLLSSITQGLHVERFGDGAPLIVLEAVTVTPAPPATAVAAHGSDTRLQ